MKISYTVALTKQGTQECVQASASQILSYYGIHKTIMDIKKEVPVYIDSQGINRGTSLGHIAAHFQKLGLSTILHTSDVILFDPSWKKIDSTNLITKLKARLPHLVHGWYDKTTLTLIVDGYIQYLNNGGQIIFPIIDIPYILKYLKQGPIYMTVSYNVLNQCSKYDFTKIDTQDDLKGLPSTHAIVISGYSNGTFDIVDPDINYGGYRKIPESRLLAAFYLAETDMDCLFISFKK